MKTLVVYYSRTGNARFVAQTIAAEVGADIEEVIDLKKRSGILGYLRGGSDARRGKETEIAPTTKSPASYDLIIVGTPFGLDGQHPPSQLTLKKMIFQERRLHFSLLKEAKNPQLLKKLKL